MAKTQLLVLIGALAKMANGSYHYQQSALAKSGLTREQTNINTKETR